MTGPRKPCADRFCLAATGCKQSLGLPMLMRFAAVPVCGGMQAFAAAGFDVVASVF
ncbi:MAG: hypothetical protein ABI870_09070 [Rhodanobacter sp.]